MCRRHANLSLMRTAYCPLRSAAQFPFRERSIRTSIKDMDMSFSLCSLGISVVRLSSIFFLCVCVLCCFFSSLFGHHFLFGIWVFVYGSKIELLIRNVYTRILSLCYHHAVGSARVRMMMVSVKRHGIGPLILRSVK